MNPPDVVARYCPNKQCPNLQVTGKPRHLGESAIGAYTKIKCTSCKKWWAFNSHPALEDEGVEVIQDVVIGAEG